MRKRYVYPSMLLTALTLAACGGGGGGGNTGSTTAAGTTTIASEIGNAIAAVTGSSSASTTTSTSQSAGASTTSASTTSTSQSGATAASTTTTTQVSGTTINQVIADMSSASEALVINPQYSWQYNPQITQYSPAGSSIPNWWTGNRPTWCYSVLTWFTAFEAQGNTATNTRVQVKNLRFYVLSQSSRTWKQFDVKAAPGVDMWTYPFTYNGASSGSRNEASGGISIKPQYPNFHHGYGNSITITPQDVRAVFVAMDFRLTVDDTSKPDDRANAKYVVDTGGDYWPGNGQATWSLGYAPGMGNGRMLQATSNWRTASLLIPNTDYGSNFTELANNPPPLN